MSRSFVRIVVATCMAAGALLAAPTAGAAAGSAAAAAADDQPKVSRTLGPSLKAAQEAMKANDFAGALAHVHEAQAVPDHTAYDDYTINEFLANIAIAQKDYTAALTPYEAMSDSPAAPVADKAHNLTTTVLLAANLGQWPVIIRYGEQLQAMGPLEARIAAPLAVAYYNTGDTAKALSLAQAQVAAAKAAGQVPDQGLLDIVARSQLKQNDLKASAQSLEMLAQNYGDANDWGQLIDLAFTSKGLTDIDALYYYRLRIVTGAATNPDDYAIMGQVTAKQGYPGETVAMLERGIAKGEIHAGDAKIAGVLATARQKEVEDKKTLPAFDVQARAHKTGDYDIKLAETYYGYGRYAEAAEAAQRAIAKGSLKSPNEGLLVLGMALVGVGKDADAVDAFAKVAGREVDRSVAHLWTLYATRKYGVAPAAH